MHKFRWQDTCNAKGPITLFFLFLLGKEEALKWFPLTLFVGTIHIHAAWARAFHTTTYWWAEHLKQAYVKYMNTSLKYG